MNLEWKILIAVVLVLLIAYVIRRIVTTKQQARRIAQVQDRRLREEGKK